MHLCEQNIIKSLIYTSDNSTYSLTKHENYVPSMLSYRALTVYAYIYVYIFIYEYICIYIYIYIHIYIYIYIYIYVYFVFNNVISLQLRDNFHNIIINILHMYIKSRI